MKSFKSFSTWLIAFLIISSMITTNAQTPSTTAYQRLYTGTTYGSFLQHQNSEGDCVIPFGNHSEYLIFGSTKEVGLTETKELRIKVNGSTGWMSGSATTNYPNNVYSRAVDAEEVFGGQVGVVLTQSEFSSWPPTGRNNMTYYEFNPISMKIWGFPGVANTIAYGVGQFDFSNYGPPSPPVYRGDDVVAKDLYFHYNTPNLKTLIGDVEITDDRSGLSAPHVAHPFGKKGIVFHEIDYSPIPGGVNVLASQFVYENDNNYNFNLHATRMVELYGGEYFIAGTVEDPYNGISYTCYLVTNSNYQVSKAYFFTGNGHEECIDMIANNGTTNEITILSKRTNPTLGNKSEMVIRRFGLNVTYEPVYSDGGIFHFYNNDDLDPAGIEFDRNIGKNSYVVAYTKIYSGTSTPYASVMNISLAPSTSGRVVNVNWNNEYREDSRVNDINYIINGFGFEFLITGVANGNEAYAGRIGANGLVKPSAVTALTCYNSYSVSNTKLVDGHTAFSTSQDFYAFYGEGGDDITKSEYNFGDQDACDPCNGINVSVTASSPNICLGSGSSNLSASASTPGTFEWQYFVPSPAPGSFSFLASGSSTTVYTPNVYRVKFTETATGCVSYKQIEIVSKPHYSVDVVDLDCGKGVTTGSATVQMIDPPGTGSVTFSWVSTGTSSPILSTSQSLTGVNAGDYDVTVTYAGCSYTTTITIDEVERPIWEWKYAEYNCDVTSTSEKGVVWVQDANYLNEPITGWPYTIKYEWWDAGFGSLLATTPNIEAGNGDQYNLIITYGLCDPETLTEVFSQELEMELSQAVQIDYSNFCAQGAEVTFKLKFGRVDHLDPMTNVYYEIDQTNGPYNVTVPLNSTNLFETVDHNLRYPGSPAREYAWMETNLLTHYLPEGEFDIILHVPDYECEKYFGPVEIDYDSGIEGYALEDPIYADCITGLANNVAVAAKGGQGPYTFKWYNSTPALPGTMPALPYYGAVMSGLPVGDYDIEVTDAAGCSEIFSISILPNTNIPGITSVTHTDCEGTVTLNGSGIAPFRVEWHRLVETSPTDVYNIEFSEVISGTTSIAPNLPQGTYKIVVVDANGCSAIYSPKVIDPYPTGRTIQICYRWGLPETPEPHKDAVPEQPETKQQDQVSSAISALNSKTQGCVEKIAGTGKAAFIKQCLSSKGLNDKLTLNYDLNYRHYTLYFYDRAGNLTKTVAPNGIHEKIIGASIPSDRLSKVAFNFESKYTFNSLKQLTDQKTPDVNDKTNHLYNSLGQLRFSQSAQQKLDETFSYTKYDELDRIVEVGICDINDYGSTAFSVLNNPTYLEPVVNSGVVDVASTHPNGNVTERIITEYNEPISGIQYLGEDQQNTSNRISQAYTDEDGNLGTDEDQVHTFYSYDQHGNVEWLIQDVPGIGKNYVRYQYDLLSGNVIWVGYNEFRDDKFFHRYEYDADNRIVEVETSIDGVIWEEDGNYTYYHHGPLKRLEIGEDKIQGLDYTYTLNDWIKALNHPYREYNGNIGYAEEMDPGKDGSIGSNFEEDVYGYSLGYFQDDYKHYDFNGSGSNTLSPYSNFSTSGDLFNGNIAYISSALAHGQAGQAVDDKEMTGTQFTYDQLNRLIVADNNNSALTSNPAFYQNSFNNFDSDYRYDANGNILDLSRNAHNSGTPSQNEIDDLDYTYTTGRNRLEKVEDVTTNTALDGTLNDIAGISNYTYDANGNLISDDGEEIMEIKWNAYGKVSEIIPDYNAGGNQKPWIKFYYDANGNRVIKQVNNNPYVPGGASLQWNEEDVLTTYYLRDASGNVMSIYNRNNIDLGGGQYEPNFVLKEQTIYGSERLGIRVPEDVTSPITGDPYEPGSSIGHADHSSDPLTLPDLSDGNYFRYANQKRYELKNHLSNVAAVVSDVKDASNGIVFQDEFTGGINGSWTTYGSSALGHDAVDDRMIVETYASSSGASIDISTDPYQMYNIQLDLNKDYPTTDVHIEVYDITSSPALITSEGLNTGENTVYFYTPAGCIDVEIRMIRTSSGSFAEFFVDNFTVTKGKNYAIYNLADVTSYQDYYPFGSVMADRNYTAGGSYRYAFNGMERDNEFKGNFNSYDFEARLFDSRTARWMSLDQMEAKYPNLSPYSFASNNPIYYIDPDGNEVEIYVTAKKVGTTKINLYSSGEIKKDASLANKKKIVAVYEVRIRNESGQTATFYFTRTAYRGQTDGTTKEVTFDVRNDKDEFLGQVKSRWSGTNNVLELRDKDDINDQSVEAMKADEDAIRTAIQFHVKGASDGCLLCVGSAQFESKDELIDDTDLQTNSSGSQRNFMDKIIEFRDEDEKNGYGTDINIKFDKSSSDDGALKKRMVKKYGNQQNKFE